MEKYTNSRRVVIKPPLKRLIRGIHVGKEKHRPGRRGARLCHDHFPHHGNGAGHGGFAPVRRGVLPPMPSLPPSRSPTCSAVFSPRGRSPRPSFRPFPNGTPRRGEEEARELANICFTLLTIVMAAVTLLGIIFSPQIVHLMFPGLSRLSPSKAGIDDFSQPADVPLYLLHQPRGPLHGDTQHGAPFLHPGHLHGLPQSLHDLLRRLSPRSLPGADHCPGRRGAGSADYSNSSCSSRLSTERVSRSVPVSISAIRQCRRSPSSWGRRCSGSGSTT